MPQTSLDQIVNHIPGIWAPTIPTGQLHPTGQPFNIRGFGSSTTINTLVMVDGVPINDPYFRTVDWSQVSKASIERIEVIRGGGATSLWGNMAMGGVVNIITRQPSRTGVGLDANYGSYNTFNGEGYGSMIFNDKLKCRPELQPFAEQRLQPHARAVPEPQPGADGVVGRQRRLLRLLNSVRFDPSCSPRPTSTRRPRAAWSGRWRTISGRAIACCWAARTSSTTSRRSISAPGPAAASSPRPTPAAAATR